MAEPSLDNLAFQQQFERAQSVANHANLTEPRAISVSYDSALELVIVRLQSGAIFSFPPAIAQGLAGAKPEDLTQVEVTPMGDGLHWPTLDADFSVAGLLAGVFVTPALDGRFTTTMVSATGILKSNPCRGDRLLFTH